MGAAKAVRERSASALAYVLFAEAMALPESQRGDFLDARCGGDTRLRTDVHELLAIAARDEVATGALCGPAHAGADEESWVGRVIGRFRLVERIGAGGMGVVYRAERIDGVQQSVAVKLVATSMASVAQSRFEREAQLLARLEHPSIARLIDAGVQDTRAWIAIEFVRGKRIDEYCRDLQLQPRDIVRLLIRLADAVAAAHRLLVVHSDIKPANVLVGAEGVPKLVDFGISTALREADGHSSTVNVARMFSPNYAAPEQINGTPLSVATDVFGLGALAYRLLTGVPPYADAQDPIAYLLAISQRDVELGSQAARTAGRDASLVRALRGDLDAILAKALERDPQRRYSTATEMQADLTRYLDARPVHARTPTWAYRVKKFVSRNQVAVGLTALLLIAITGGATSAALQARKASIAQAMAARRGEFLESVLKSADPRSGKRDLSLAELLDSAAGALDDKLSEEPLVEASMLGLVADTDVGLGRYPQALAASDRQLMLLETHDGGALDIGRALTSRGRVLREQGIWLEDEKVMRRAVALLRPLNAKPELARALFELAAVLAHTDQEREAESDYREELALEAAGPPELRAHRSYTYYALGGLLTNLGRYREALQYELESIELAKRTMPADHQDLLTFQAQYASTLISSNQPAPAEAVLRDVIEKDTRVSGADHKDVLLTQSLLADDLVELQRYDEAAELALKAASALDALLGGDNSYSLTAWQTFAIATCSEGDFSRGLEVAQRISAARVRLYPANHRFVHAAAAAVGLCLYRAHRYAEAEPILLSAAAGLEATRGEHYRFTQLAYRLLRDLYEATGRPDTARSYSARLLPDAAHSR